MRHHRPPGPLLIATALLAASLLSGCATAPAPPPAAAPSSEAPAEDSVTELLERAREDYFHGVRSFVREDLPAAEDAFWRCRARLEGPLPAGTFSELDLREAESLLSKSDYFLRKISGQDLAARETVETVVETDVAAGRPRWELATAPITAVRNRNVDRWLEYFQKDGRSVIQKWLNRRSRHEPVVNEALARHGLPPELIYHAMIESGFSCRAYSWAHAVGMWQFIRSTGRKYGLRSDWWIDERRDPAKSSEAAATYLKMLYDEFGDWNLALAAYNVGEGVVRRQIRRQKTKDFWKLRLPRETRNHVPKFYAALIIGTDPGKYGFTLQPEQPWDTEDIVVDFCVDFEVLGESCGVSPETLAELNPSLVRHCSPPDDDGYTVRVPAGTGQRALARLTKVPEDQRVRWAHHRVRSGETLSHIAERYRTTVRGICEANGLRNAHLLSIGQDLLIPQGRRSGANPPRYASTSPSSRSSAPEGSRRITYVVRKNDTLSEIAERYGTSSRMLRRWNRIGRYIFPGQRLKIHTRKSSGGSRRTFEAIEDGGGLFVKVRKGDTLWDIARYHGVTVAALRTANDLRRSDLIRPGDRIRIPKRSG